MPTVQEVRCSFQPQDPRGAYIASIAFKAAHKQVKVHSTEQGLLLSQLGMLFTNFSIISQPLRKSARSSRTAEPALLEATANPRIEWKETLPSSHSPASPHHPGRPHYLPTPLHLAGCPHTPISWKKASIGENLVGAVAALPNEKSCLQIHGLFSKFKCREGP